MDCCLLVYPSSVAFVHLFPVRSFFRSFVFPSLVHSFFSFVLNFFLLLTISFLHLFCGSIIVNYSFILFYLYIRWFVRSFARSFLDPSIHSFISAFIPSFAYSGSRTHARTHARTHSLSHSLTRKVNSKSKRGQAGVSLLIKNKHFDYVSHIKSASPNIIWCHLLNDSFLP